MTDWLDYRYRSPHTRTSVRHTAAQLDSAECRAYPVALLQGDLQPV